MQIVIQHTLTLLEHFPIRKAHHPITACLQIRSPLGVIRHSRVGSVLVAVQFDNQLDRVTDEIRNISSERRLPPEMQARLFEIAQDALGVDP